MSRVTGVRQVAVPLLGGAMKRAHTNAFDEHDAMDDACGDSFAAAAPWGAMQAEPSAPQHWNMPGPSAPPLPPNDAATAAAAPPLVWGRPDLDASIDADAAGMLDQGGGEQALVAPAPRGTSTSNILSFVPRPVQHNQPPQQRFVLRIPRMAVPDGAPPQAANDPQHVDQMFM